MLKKIYRKKILLCMIVFFSLFLIYIMPAKEEDIDIKQELIYVNKEIKTNDIFLLDANNYLAKTKIITKKNTIEDKAKELIEALTIEGNMQDNIPNGFKAIIPNGTKVRSLTIANDIIKVDLTKEFLNTNIKNEEKVIEALTYTLTTLDGIKGIMIFIEGELLTQLPQTKITLPSTLDRSYGINKEYNITKPNDITKTTIYYISKFNENEYYVPVTKVTNDTRSKIEIIIDELSSSNVYRTNLMSYLNSNTEILSSNQVDNELVVNFNSAIFDDIDTKQILEEVIYTITMSINDNYDIDTVVFNVNDQEIYKSVMKTIE